VVNNIGAQQFSRYQVLFQPRARAGILEGARIDTRSPLPAARLGSEKRP
jgi:hypothetical protein